MLSSFRRIRTNAFFKSIKSSIIKKKSPQLQSRFRSIIRKHMYYTRNKLHTINHSHNNIKALYTFKYKSFCSKSNPITKQGEDTHRSKRQQYRFAVQFLYLPFFATIGTCIVYREEILTYFMQQIFKRREEFIKQCYPTRIILIRHGQSSANVDQIILGTIPDHQIPLTHLGYTQALAAGRKLKALIDEEDLYAYYSPYKRAQETLYGILEGGNLHKQTKVQIEDVRLIEQKFGNHQTKEQMEQEKLSRLKYGRYFYQFKYGESGLSVTLRATAFTDRLFDHFRTGYYSTRPEREWNVLIVSHGLFMRVFLKTFLRKTVADFQKWYNYANCEMCILVKDKQGEYYVSQDTPLPLTPRKRSALND